ncbi:hypothetical protein, partial [Hominenteromicrobium sp.]|uniref:hypothetical protein n=1 Tax=Hominenteromicrobium sp. TaxID=3073581 RepID=UPI003A95D33B
ISIHALRVEGDHRQPPLLARSRISIHALRVEGDLREKFPGIDVASISIHALRVEGDLFNLNVWCEYKISIHALRVEGDSKNGQSFHLFLRKREKNLPL